MLLTNIYYYCNLYIYIYINYFGKEMNNIFVINNYNFIFILL